MLAALLSESKGSPLAVYGYVRVSTKGQADERSVSLETQRRVIGETAAKHNLTLNPEDVHSEVGSAYNGNQPRLETLYGLAKKAVRRARAGRWHDGPGAIILVYSYDRFSRQCKRGLSRLDNWRANDVYIVSATEDLDYRTPSGRLLLSNILSGAEFQSRMIGEKIRDAIATQKRLGSVVGPAPFGFRKRKRPTSASGSDANAASDQSGQSGKPPAIWELEEDAREMEIVGLIQRIRSGGDAKAINEVLFRLVKPEFRVPIVFEQGDDELVNGPSPGGISYANIAALLNEYEIARRKGRWTAHTVRRAASSSSAHRKPGSIPSVDTVHDRADNKDDVAMTSSGGDGKVGPFDVPMFAVRLPVEGGQGFADSTPAREMRAFVKRAKHNGRVTRSQTRAALAAAAEQPAAAYSDDVEVASLRDEEKVRESAGEPTFTIELPTEYAANSTKADRAGPVQVRRQIQIDLAHEADIHGVSQRNAPAPDDGAPAGGPSFSLLSHYFDEKRPPNSSNPPNPIRQPPAPEAKSQDHDAEVLDDSDPDVMDGNDAEDDADGAHGLIARGGFTEMIDRLEQLVLDLKSVPLAKKPKLTTTHSTAPDGARTTTTTSTWSAKFTARPRQPPAAPAAQVAATSAADRAGTAPLASAPSSASVSVSAAADTGISTDLLRRPPWLRSAQVPSSVRRAAAALRQAAAGTAPSTVAPAGAVRPATRAVVPRFTVIPDLK